MSVVFEEHKKQEEAKRAKDHARAKENLQRTLDKLRHDMARLMDSPQTEDVIGALRIGREALSYGMKSLEQYPDEIPKAEDKKNN